MGRRETPFSARVKDSNSTLYEVGIFLISSDEEHSFSGSVRSIPQLEQSIFKVLVIRTVTYLGMSLGWLKQTAEMPVVVLRILESFVAVTTSLRTV